MEVVNSSDKKFHVPGCIEQPIFFNEDDIPVCRKIACKFFDECLTAEGHPLMPVEYRPKE